jgi:hypothetical protein
MISKLTEVKTNNVTSKREVCVKFKIQKYEIPPPFSIIFILKRFTVVKRLVFIESN